MASSEEKCNEDPNFAVICSFLIKFGEQCGFNFNIDNLQKMLEDTKDVHEELQDIHIRLLRKSRKWFSKDKWEKALVKFCHEYSNVDAWELERFGYKKAKLSVKLELLKRLLELQFDCNTKFKGEVNRIEAAALRILPIGKDVNGKMYWFQMDKDMNIRVYCETPENDTSWKLVCKSRDDLVALINSLESKKENPCKEDTMSSIFSENGDSNLTAGAKAVEAVQGKTEVTDTGQKEKKTEDSSKTTEAKPSFANLKLPSHENPLDLSDLSHSKDVVKVEEQEKGNKEETGSKTLSLRIKQEPLDEESCSEVKEHDAAAQSTIKNKVTKMEPSAVLASDPTTSVSKESKEQNSSEQVRCENFSEETRSGFSATDEPVEISDPSKNTEVPVHAPSPPTATLNLEPAKESAISEPNKESKEIITDIPAKPMSKSNTPSDSVTTPESESKKEESVSTVPPPVTCTQSSPCDTTSGPCTKVSVILKVPATARTVPQKSNADRCPDSSTSHSLNKASNDNLSSEGNQQDKKYEVGHPQSSLIQHLRKSPVADLKTGELGDTFDQKTTTSILTSKKTVPCSPDKGLDLNNSRQDDKNETSKAIMAAKTVSHISVITTEKGTDKSTPESPSVVQKCRTSPIEHESEKSGSRSVHEERVHRDSSDLPKDFGPKLTQPKGIPPLIPTRCSPKPMKMNMLKPMDMPLDFSSGDKSHVEINRPIPQAHHSSFGSLVEKQVDHLRTGLPVICENKPMDLAPTDRNTSTGEQSRPMGNIFKGIDKRNKDFSRMSPIKYWQRADELAALESSEHRVSEQRTCIVGASWDNHSGDRKEKRSSIEIHSDAKSVEHRESFINASLIKSAKPEEDTRPLKDLGCSTTDSMKIINPGMGSFFSDRCGPQVEVAYGVDNIGEMMKLVGNVGKPRIEKSSEESSRPSIGYTEKFSMPSQHPGMSTAAKERKIEGVIASLTLKQKAALIKEKETSGSEMIHDNEDKGVELPPSSAMHKRSNVARRPLALCRQSNVFATQEGPDDEECAKTKGCSIIATSNIEKPASNTNKNSKESITVETESLIQQKGSSSVYQEEAVEKAEDNKTEKESKKDAKISDSDNKSMFYNVGIKQIIAMQLSKNTFTKSELLAEQNRPSFLQWSALGNDSNQPTAEPLKNISGGFATKCEVSNSKEEPLNCTSKSRSKSDDGIERSAQISSPNREKKETSDMKSKNSNTDTDNQPCKKDCSISGRKIDDKEEAESVKEIPPLEDALNSCATKGGIDKQGETSKASSLVKVPPPLKKHTIMSPRKKILDAFKAMFESQSAKAAIPSTESTSCVVEPSPVAESVKVMDAILDKVSAGTTKVGESISIRPQNLNESNPGKEESVPSKVNLESKEFNQTSSATEKLTSESNGTKAKDTDCSSMTEALKQSEEAKETMAEQQPLVSKSEEPPSEVISVKDNSSKKELKSNEMPSGVQKVDDCPKKDAPQSDSTSEFTIALPNPQDDHAKEMSSESDDAKEKNSKDTDTKKRSSENDGAKEKNSKDTDTKKRSSENDDAKEKNSKDTDTNKRSSENDDAREKNSKGTDTKKRSSENDDANEKNSKDTGAKEKTSKDTDAKKRISENDDVKEKNSNDTDDKKRSSENDDGKEKSKDTDAKKRSSENAKEKNSKDTDAQERISENAATKEGSSESSVVRDVTANLLQAVESGGKASTKKRSKLDELLVRSEERFHKKLHESLAEEATKGLSKISEVCRNKPDIVDSKQFHETSLEGQPDPSVTMDNIDSVVSKDTNVAQSESKKEQTPEGSTPVIESDKHSKDGPIKTNENKAESVCQSDSNEKQQLEESLVSDKTTPDTLATPQLIESNKTWVDGKEEKLAKEEISVSGKEVDDSIDRPVASDSDSEDEEHLPHSQEEVIKTKEPAVIQEKLSASKTPEIKGTDDDQEINESTEKQNDVTTDKQDNHEKQEKTRQHVSKEASPSIQESTTKKASPASEDDSEEGPLSAKRKKLEKEEEKAKKTSSEDSHNRIQSRKRSIEDTKGSSPIPVCEKLEQHSSPDVSIGKASEAEKVSKVEADSKTTCESDEKETQRVSSPKLDDTEHDKKDSKCSSKNKVSVIVASEADTPPSEKPGDEIGLETTSSSQDDAALKESGQSDKSAKSKDKSPATPAKRPTETRVSPKTPVTTMKSSTSVAATKSGTPVKTTKANTSVTTTKSSTPVKTTKPSTFVKTTKSCTPLTTTKSGTPLATTKSDAPVTTTKSDAPVATTKSSTPGKTTKSSVSEETLKMKVKSKTPDTDHKTDKDTKAKEVSSSAENKQEGQKAKMTDKGKEKCKENKNTDDAATSKSVENESEKAKTDDNSPREKNEKGLKDGTAKEGEQSDAASDTTLKGEKDDDTVKDDDKPKNTKPTKQPPAGTQTRRRTKRKTRFTYSKSDRKQKKKQQQQQQGNQTKSKAMTNTTTITNDQDEDTLLSKDDEDDCPLSVLKMKAANNALLDNSKCDDTLKDSLSVNTSIASLNGTESTLEMSLTDDSMGFRIDRCDEGVRKGGGRAAGRGRGRGGKTTLRGRGRGRGLSVYQEAWTDDSSPAEPVKRSRRIQEQNVKKMTQLAAQLEEEQRRLEALAKQRLQKAAQLASAKERKQKEVVTEAKVLGSKRKSRGRKIEVQVQDLFIEKEEERKREELQEKKSKKRKRKRAKKKTPKTGANPWDVSSESTSTSEEEFEEDEFEEEEVEEEVLNFDENDDEFACEEVEENAEPVVIRRARTAKKSRSDGEESSADGEAEQDKPCERCGNYDHPEWILLCDKCDAGYHTSCLVPPLMIIPDGDWFCPPCDHKMLCEKLNEELKNFDQMWKRKEREELRKQRLAYVGISLDNVLKPEKKPKPEIIQQPDSAPEDSMDEQLFSKRSSRQRKTVNYQFKEFDDLIASAIQDDIYDEYEEAGGYGKGKDISNITNAAESDDAAPPIKKKKRHRRLTELSSTEPEDDSDDEYKGTGSDSEVSQSAVSEELENSGDSDWRTSARGSRSRRRRASFINDGSESDESGYVQTRRRAAQKQISYREISTDEDETWAPSNKGSARKRKAQSDESEDYTESDDGWGPSKAKRQAIRKNKTKKRSQRRVWQESETSEDEEDDNLDEEEDKTDARGHKQRRKESSSSFLSDKKSKLKKTRISSEDDDDEEDEEESEESSDGFKSKRSRSRRKITYCESGSSDEEKTSTKRPCKKVMESEASEAEAPDDDDDDDDSGGAFVNKKRRRIVSDDDDEDDENEKEEKTEAVKGEAPIVTPKVEAHSVPTLDHCSSEQKQVIKSGTPIKSVLDSQAHIPAPSTFSSVDNRGHIPGPPPPFASLEKKAIHPTSLVPPPASSLPQTTPLPPNAGIKEALTSPNEVGMGPSPVVASSPVPIPHSVPVSAPVPPPVPVSAPVLPPVPVAAPVLPPVPVSVSVPPSVMPPVPVSASVSAPVMPPVPVSASVPPPVPVSATVPPPVPVSAPVPPPPVPSTASVPPSVPVLALVPPSVPAPVPMMPPHMNQEPFKSQPHVVITPSEEIRRPKARFRPIEHPQHSMSRRSPEEYTPAIEEHPDSPETLKGKSLDEPCDYSYRPNQPERAYGDPFPSCVSPLEDYPNRPSPLKPSIVETYPQAASPTKLTPLDSYSREPSPSKLTPLDSYSQSGSFEKRLSYPVSHSGGRQPSYSGGREFMHSPVPSDSYRAQGSYGQGSFYPQGYQRSSHSSPSRTASPYSPSRMEPSPSGSNSFRSYPPHGQSPTPPPGYYRHPDYYPPQEDCEGSQPPMSNFPANYTHSEGQMPYPYYGQANGGFMIDNLLRHRNPEGGEDDELTGVTDIVSYITQE